ncbi:MAG: hypothetical protein IKX58_05560, partial [Clostridia bacterium]|nr:hypothetical protein [Clostridia bacterium]
MKRFFALFLVFLMVFAMAACTGGENNGGNEGGNNNESTDANALVSKNFIDPLKDWKQYDELIKQIKT